MMPSSSVSVVVPVYNAEPFVRRAVEAALAQEEVGEVLLVEDGSTDDSLEVCRALAKESKRVRLLRHPGGVNRGAAETRNLGIRSATLDYLAFADADNFYLPGRFGGDLRLLRKDPTLDGVYNAQGVHYESDADRRAFHEAGLGFAEFLSVSAPVAPEEFWRVMLGAHPSVQMVAGLGIDAITLRRSAIDKVGLFDPSLRLQQDVHFFVRMAITCRMAPGVLDRPVAVRGVHGQMRSTDSQRMVEYRRQCWTSLRRWVRANVEDPEVRTVFEQAYFRRSAAWQGTLRRTLALIAYLARKPRALKEPYGFVDQAVFDLLEDSRVAHRAVSVKNRIFRALS